MREWVGWLCLAAVLASAAPAPAAQNPGGEQPLPRPGRASGGVKPKKQPKPVLGFTPEREAAAIAFARRHHPELAKLLAHLKRAEAGEYQRAIAALFRTSERLAQVQERKGAQYERELKAWKLKSRIQLLVAQIRIAPEKETLRTKLKQALVEQSELRSAQLIEERTRLADRLKELDAQIKQMQRERNKRVERQLELLLRQKKKRSPDDKSDAGKGAASEKPDTRAADDAKSPKRARPNQAALNLTNPSLKPAR